jgi:hypothetical protein
MAHDFFKLTSQLYESADDFVVLALEFLAFFDEVAHLVDDFLLRIEHRTPPFRC